MPPTLPLFNKPSLTASSLTALAAALIVVLMNVALGYAQSQDRQQATTSVAPLAFDVVSVKRSNPESRGLMLIRPMSGGQTYTARNVPLRLMIKAMYRITDSQIAGGPGWIDTELYDMDAKAARPSTLDELHEMFRTLLADRFQLRFHRETKEIPAYVLTVAKSGARLKHSESNEAFDVPIKPGGPGRFVGTRVAMSYLAWYLSQQLGAPVVDRTALDGFYDFTVSWSPDPGLGSPGVHYKDSSEEPAILVALQEQLGLKVELHKAPVEVFVVDHVARPEAN